jgi:dTDP-glucose 4,6-dehydratase
MLKQPLLAMGIGMHVLVTGAAGFLGSHLCDGLLAQGHSVIAVDNLLTGRLRNLEHLARESRFEFIQRDICQPFDVGPVDFVFDFASPASPVDYMKYGIETLLVGSQGTLNSLELAKKYNAGFLLASTSECYGDPQVHPQHEGYWGNVNPIGPRSVYDEAKRYAEAITMAYHREYGLDTKIVRIFNTFGPRLGAADGRVVSNFLAQAMRGAPLTIYGDGKQTRSFCFVSDEVRGLLALLDSDHVGPMNIGNPYEFTMLELAEVVLEVTAADVDLVFEPLPADDPRQRRPDISLAREVLGWEPEVGLREGLALTHDWYRRNGGIT